MDKPRSTWGFQANGERIKTKLPVLSQEEIDQIQSRYLREVYQEEKDRYEQDHAA